MTIEKEEDFNPVKKRNVNFKFYLKNTHKIKVSNNDNFNQIILPNFNMDKEIEKEVNVGMFELDFLDRYTDKDGQTFIDRGKGDIHNKKNMKKDIICDISYVIVSPEYQGKGMLPFLMDNIKKTIKEQSFRVNEVILTAQPLQASQMDRVYGMESFKKGKTFINKDKLKKVYENYGFKEIDDDSMIVSLQDFNSKTSSLKNNSKFNKKISL